MRVSSFVAAFIAVLLALTSSLWAATCAICGAEIPDGQKYCASCEKRLAKEQLTARHEKQIVDEMNKARDLYAKKLRELIQFYIDSGNYIKKKRAQQELTELKRITHYPYVVLADVLGADVHATQNIEEANQLYTDGMSYKKYPAIFNKRSYLKTAIQRFEELVRNYPESDKADDAAYRLGEIYSGFYLKDYLVAAKWFEKSFLWNERTPYPGRYKAAKL